MEPQTREPCFVRQVRQRHTLPDAPLEQLLEACQLHGGGAAPERARRRIGWQTHCVVHERGRFVARVVGAMSEENARALHAPLRSRHQVAGGRGPRPLPFLPVPFFRMPFHRVK